MLAVKTTVRSASHSCREQRSVFMLTALQFSERLVTLKVGGVDTCSEISHRESTLCISIILETIHSLIVLP